MNKTLLLIVILFSFKLHSQEIVKSFDGKLEFNLTKKCDDNNCKITKIEILKNGEIIQTVLPGKNSFSKTFPNKQLIVLNDMNFDGNTDFRIMESHTKEIWRSNTSLLYWIYNPLNQLFEKRVEYEVITSPEFDYEKKEINSIWRDGCCKHGRDVYKLINEIPLFTERFVIGRKPDNTEYYEHWKVVEGELKKVE